MAAIVNVTGGVAVSLALPGTPGPVRVYVDCRRAPASAPDAAGGPGADGTSLHILWQRSAGLLKTPADTSGVLAQVEFDGDGAIDLPEGCGTLSLIGGSGLYDVGIYSVRALAPGVYVPRRRQLTRLVNDRDPLTIPDEHDRIGSGINATLVQATTDGLTTTLTTTPETCVPGQVYSFDSPARIYTETVVF